MIYNLPVKQKSVLILKNTEREGPGLIEAILEERKIPFDLIDLIPPFTIPSPRQYGALVVMGGPDSANDQTDKMKNELLIIGEAIAEKIPYLGICLGMQALTKAVGGEVCKAPLKEVGFRDPESHFFEITLTSQGRKDPIFAGLPERLRVFQLHGETVRLSPQMELLALGKFCPNQVVKTGANAYGLQCHFELTKTMFENWLDEDSDLKTLSRSSLLRDFEEIETEYRQTGRTIIDNFLKLARFS